MNSFRKLKPEFFINDLVPFIAMIFAFSSAYILFGVAVAKWVLGAALILFAIFLLIGYARTLNPGYLVTTVANFVYGFFIWSLPVPMTTEMPTLTKILIALLLLLIPGIWYVFLTKRLKWRGREIFELAALEVREATSGYTPRPRPVGKADYTESELRAFAAFLSKYLIALPYYEPGRVLFAPIKNSQEYPFLLGIAPGTTPDLEKTTWVAFDLNGDVSAHIAHKDYLAYRDELSFDALCQALGQLFIEFLESCQRGEEVRIIERLNALGLGYFS